MGKTLELKKNIIKIDQLGEEYLSYQHPSGLTILLYPMLNYRSSFAIFGTKLGSIDTVFKTSTDDHYTTVPAGVAHFLEHKVFENEDGDAFSLFAKTGASANAYTSFDRTCYLFSATDQFQESLAHLLNFVQSPYFTEETVQKEQGIIAQEIKMYQDHPGWRVFFNLLTALYQSHPVRIDIAGTVESIAEIDAALLYQCYHTFYNPHQMVLAIAGNFSVEQALSVVEQQLKSGERVVVEQQTSEEPQEIHQQYITQQLSVSTPLFHMGFKEIPKTGYALLETHIAYEILLELIAGESSSLYRRLYDTGLINQHFDTEVLSGRGFLANIIAGESKDPKRVYQEICKEIEKIKQIGIAERDFSRIKKSFYGKMIQGFNQVENVANSLVTSFFAGFNLFDHLKVIEKMTCATINQQLQQCLMIDQSALSIIEPLT